MPDFSDYIIFVDESGDHGLQSVEPEYPIFVLAFCIFRKDEYARQVVPTVLEFKFRYFGHDQIVLHEHEIRKTKGAFKILFEPEIRETFYEDLNDLIMASPFTIVASVIHKEKLRMFQDAPNNPYHIALEFGLECAYGFLLDQGCEAGIAHILFECRGKREDAELELEFRRVCDGRNTFGRRLPFEIVMADKRCNSAGLQLADLVARPIGRKMLKPEQPNRAYDILSTKFRIGPDGHVETLKMYP